MEKEKGKIIALKSAIFLSETMKYAKRKRNYKTNYIV